MHNCTVASTLSRHKQLQSGLAYKHARHSQITLRAPRVFPPPSNDPNKKGSLLNSHAITKASGTLDLRAAQTTRDPSSKKATTESNIPPPTFCRDVVGRKSKMLTQALQAEQHACRATANMYHVHGCSSTCTGKYLSYTAKQLITTPRQES